MLPKFRPSVLRCFSVGRKAFALLLSSLLVACAPEAGPVEMAVLEWDPQKGVFELATATIHTLDDVTALRGEAATLIGDAEIVIGPRVKLARTARELREAVLDDEGGAVEAQFVEQDGVLYPSDFHSLNLATTYYNFERARAYALARGMPPELLRGVPVYYFPEVRMQGIRGPLADNAGWFALLQSFLLFPIDEVREIPLAMNLGVIAHEYGHGLFNALVHRGSALPDYQARWCPDGICRDVRGVRMLGIVEEGFADAWAIGATGNLRFIHHSLPSEGDKRDLEPFDATRHCYTQAALEQEIRDTSRFSSTDRENYWGPRQYQIGTVIAGALYRAGKSPETDMDRVMEALLASYGARGEGSLAEVLASDATGSTFGTFASIARAVIGATDHAPTRRALCAAWMDRLAIPASELGGMCDDAPSNGECLP